MTTSANNEVNTEHKKMVAALVKTGEAIIHDLTESTAHLLHMAVGVSGEAGELLDAIKKSAIYCKPLDLQNVIEELGDIEFYLEGIRAALGITRELTLAMNMQKLEVRYAQKTFSNSQAQERKDKVK